MDREQFLRDFADIFDDTDSDEINYKTNFHDLDEWSSICVLGLIALSKTSYNKSISGKEIKDCQTVEDIFNLIKNK